MYSSMLKCGFLHLLVDVISSFCCCCEQWKTPRKKAIAYQGRKVLVSKIRAHSRPWHELLWQQSNVLLAFIIRPLLVFLTNVQPIKFTFQRRLLSLLLGFFFLGWGDRKTIQYFKCIILVCMCVVAQQSLAMTSFVKVQCLPPACVLMSWLFPLQIACGSEHNLAIVGEYSPSRFHNLSV